MQFLSSNNQAHNETLFFESFFTQSNNSIHSFPPRINPNISTAIDEHISLLGSTNNQFGCNTQPLNTCLDLQQVLSQYLSAQPCSGSNIFNTNPPESLNSFNHNTATVPIYPLQMVMNQLREGTSNIDPCSSVNTRPLPVQAQLTHTPTIMYHSIEDCIIDENNMFGNINVLNADETKQTKIVIMPTVVYGKYLQPILDQIKERLFNHQPFQTDISSNNSSLTPDNTELCERVLSVADHNQQINMDNEIEEEDDLFSQDEQSTKVLSMEVKNSNNYKKTNNKKGIKKKRKYIKSGLYRKNRNGDFLFSSADRSRLATLIVTTPGGSTSQQANGELDINQSSTDNESPSDRYYDNSEDRLGFELYCRETVPLHKDAGSNTLLLKEQWKVLPQEERDRYKQSVAMGAIMQTQQIIHQDFSQGELFTQLENEDFSEMVKDTNGKYSRVKRPLNAYNIFCKLHFPEFQQQYPDLSINQISKLIGEKWKSLSIDEKQPYIEKSKNSQCKVVFKKPLNSYNLYCKQNFELFKKKYPELSIHLLSRKVADSWKSLGEDVKRTYYEDALKQRQENLVQVQQTISK